VQLLDYQHHGIKWVADTPRCGLFFPMGRGKTVTALTAADMLLMLGDARRVLVIGPKLAIQHTWPDELKLWPHLHHLTYTVLSGERELRVANLAGPQKTHLYFINRENVVWLVRECARHNKWPFDTVIIDESPSFKSPSAKRFKALKMLVKANLIRRMVILTGTPATNSLLDLWAQIFLLDGGERLGRTFQAYKDSWFAPNHDATKWLPRAGAEQQIFEAIADLIMALPEDENRLPPAVVDVPVDLDVDALARYKLMERDALLPLANGEVVTAPSAAILANKLLQMSSGFIYHTDKATEYRETHRFHNAKVDALEGIVEGLQGHTLLVGYNYEAECHAIRQRFPGAVEIREAGAVERWNRGEIQMLLAHPASAGHSLNLQFGGHYLAWFSLPWSLEHYLQFNARLARPGQKHLVSIFRLLAQGTADGDMPRMLDIKNARQDRLLDFLRARTALRYAA
jgi:hypothetical protein